MGLTLLFLFSLAACGAADGGGETGVSADSASAQDNGFYKESEPAGATEESGVDFSTVRENAKLILRADLSVETQTVDDTVSSIERMTAEAGGYIESSSTHGELGSRYMSYTVRVPQEKYEGFLAQVGDTCHVVSSDRSAEDISEQYTDIETRLATLQTKHERLLTLLDQADKMEDIIALENALADCEYEIDSLTGAKRHYDSLVGFSTISLSVREVQALSAVSGGTGFGAQLSQAAKSGLHGLTGFARGLIITLVALWPLVLVLGAGFAVFWNVRKRRKAKREQEQDK